MPRGRTIIAEIEAKRKFAHSSRQYPDAVKKRHPTLAGT
jgi:hypothetical protein